MSKVVDINQLRTLRICDELHLKDQRGLWPDDPRKAWDDFINSLPRSGCLHKDMKDRGSEYDYYFMGDWRKKIRESSGN